LRASLRAGPPNKQRYDARRTARKAETFIRHRTANAGKKRRNTMELDVGGSSAAWYVAVLAAGLVTGLVIAWLRGETKRDD
jgi:hypothetical protein